MTTFRALLSRLTHGTLLRKVVGNTLWQMSDKIARMAVGLIVGIWIARYLGPEDFGLLNFAIAFVALFTPFADLGLQAVVVRDLNRRPEDRLQIVASALALRVIGAGVAFALAMAAIAWFRPDTAARMAVLAVVLSLFLQAWDVVDYDYQARMHARPIVVIRTVSLVVFALIKIGMIVAEANVAAFALAITGEAALSAVSMRLLFKRELAGFSIARASASEMRRLLEELLAARGRSNVRGSVHAHRSGHAERDAE